MTRHLILTGFMGSGKTTIGRLLAARLGRPFLDTDAVIEQRAGQTIPALFASAGEATFRAHENAVARWLTTQRGLVVATGGGFLLNPDNERLLAPHATIVCLMADPDTLIARLAGSDRPLLQSADPVARIRELLTARAPVYSRFPAVETGGKSADTVLADLLTLLFPRTMPPIPPARTTLPVTHPSGAYSLHIGHTLLADWRTLSGISGPAVVVSDEHVAPLYASHLPDTLGVITIPPGESHKTLATLERIHTGLLAAGLDRGGTVIALGGGVTGDLAGFAAATWMRGVRLVQCPTTLLAMVDASVGGKTGVDLPGGKNLVGAFKQPEAVLIDLATLATLPPEEFAAGMAEVIKHGLIGDAALFAELEREPATPQMEPAALHALVERAVRVKQEIVQRDPYEQGERALLNLGHTFGHALEQVTGYAVRHGEAVAIGLVLAARLSAETGHCPPDLPDRIARVVAAHGLPVQLPPADPDALLAAMQSDKKKAQGRVRFVLPRAVGDCFVSADISPATVRRILT